MLVQNKIFTAESPRTQDKALDRCHSHQTIFDLNPEGKRLLIQSRASRD